MFTTRPSHCPFTLLTLIAASLAVLSICANADPKPDHHLQGSVVTGDTPIANTKISLYSSHAGHGHQPLASTHTDADGRFNLDYQLPKGKQPVLYLTTRGGRLVGSHQAVPKQYSLALVLPAPWPETVTLNDRSTVASAFMMAQYLKGRGLSGKNPGLTLASQMVNNLIDVETGDPGTTIANDDNDPGSGFSALKTLNEMSNLVASCATSAATCKAMMKLALPLRGPAPKNTFRAVANMARNPWRNPVPLFNLVSTNIYQQDLGSTPPSAWVLSLKFKGSPTTLAGPGNVVFDREGQMWIANNLVTDETYVLPDCGSQLLFKMSPVTGDVQTYSGGGVIGAGYGINIQAKTGNVWVGNFGFKGSTCPGELANNSVSEFAPDGTPLSPDATSFDRFGNPENGGWTNGGIGWPQGTVSNKQGDIWIANCNGQTTDQGQADVTIYRRGNPDKFITIVDDQLEKAFDVAFDRQGTAWVSAQVSDNITAFDHKGRKLAQFDLGDNAKPMGVASDSRGNIWVSLSGQVELPCPTAPDASATGIAGIAMVNHKGIQLNTRAKTLTETPPIAPGGLQASWGMAVDGADNVWVSNFTGKGGLSSFCGANLSSCPDGFRTGDPLSPTRTAYHSDLLDRNTAVEIDTAGNVWVTNNWKDLPIQTDPAGDSMVVFLGLAAPVKTPLIGVPRRP